MKHEKLREFLKPDAMKRLCRDYVLEHKNPTFLSWDEVIENGKEWDDDIDYDYNGYRICDVSGEKEIPFTGLLYELFPDGSLLCKITMKTDSEQDLMLLSFLREN